MKISRSAGYGMVAVGYIADNSKDGAVLASRISKEYNIPMEYLLKILQQLVRANILRSKRGPRGGFTMARPTKEITMLEIIEAVSGPLTSHLDLEQQTKNAPFSKKMEKVVEEATAKAEAFLSKIKLSEMM
ncbi:MAG: Rrf2 family transcriptional regulator [Sedimentisphaerales bacterium]|nr:Rrf2 family transcriptional regulator [Sedimentisphaerales bacterium]